MVKPRTAFWRLKNTGGGTPGPAIQVVGTTASISTMAVPSSTAIQVDDGEGWQDFVTLEASAWYHPDAMVQIDYANDRARIKGTSYASLAAARSAGAIVVDANGSDTVTGLALGAAYTMVAKGVTGPTLPTNTQARVNIVFLDDNDTDLGDEIAAISWDRTDGGLIYPPLIRGGVSQTSAIGVGSQARKPTPQSTAFGVAASVERNNTAMSVNGAGAGVDTACEVPVVTRLIVGNNQSGADPARKWTGTISQILIINAAVATGDLNGLSA